MTFDKHFRALKRKDNGHTWFDISVYELVSAIQKATGCDKIEAEENIRWMLEDCFDVHYKGCTYAVQEVF
jgi:hypothetical protein